MLLNHSLLCLTSLLAPSSLYMSRKSRWAMCHYIIDENIVCFTSLQMISAWCNWAIVFLCLIHFRWEDVFVYASMARDNVVFPQSVSVKSKLQRPAVSISCDAKRREIRNDLSRWALRILLYVLNLRNRDRSSPGHMDLKNVLLLSGSRALASIGERGSTELLSLNW